MTNATTEDERQPQRRRTMVDKQLRPRGISDPRVLDAMMTVPRELFVPPDLRDEAYENRALPLGLGQTISQPYIVARMTELLRVRPGMKVLEVGTGSGYQTAILARLGAQVVTIERSPELTDRARIALAQACPGADIRIILADGTLGYTQGAPFDRILVTAAAPHVPQAYKTQLADPGRIVIPLGDRHSQTLAVIERQGNQLTQTEDIACRFVPLMGEDGWTP